jgi:GT2 family glycosyltransferase
MTPLASVIVVNYNGGDLLLPCLQSLQRQTVADLEVILVDNASRDDSLEAACKLPREWPSLIILPQKENLGFAGGCCKGLKAARGRLIALLNNDAIAHERWLEHLVNGMESDPCIGICASKIMVHGENIIDSAGDGYSSAGKGFKRGEGKPGDVYNKQEFVFGACAGAALYRREMIEETGFLDEDFFLIHEDTDLNWRAHLFGWKVLYVPEAMVHHRVRSSIGHNSYVSVYYTVRNNELVRIKNLPLSFFVRHLFPMALGEITMLVYFCMVVKRPIAYLRGKIDAVRMAPRFLKKRRSLLDKGDPSPQELEAWVTSVWDRGFLKQKLSKFRL